MDVNSLTIDYRKMKKLTAREKLDAIQKAPNAPSFLASLTPTQLAQLFPDYFRRQLPDVGKATTGATPMSRSDTGGTTSRYTPPTSPGLKTRDGRSIPGQDPGALMEGIGLDSSGVRTAPRSPGVKMSWEDRLNTASNEKRTETMLQRGKINPLGKTRIQAGGDKLTTDEKKHFYALAVAEVGKDPKAVMSFMETVYNRYAANSKRYKNFADALNINFKNMGRKSIYFEPLRPGTSGMNNYNNALREFENNENILKQFDQLHNNVLLGTNYSNYGTHNASAGVYADAQRGGYDAVPSTAHKMPGGEGTYNKSWEMNWVRSISSEMSMWVASGHSLEDASAIPDQDPSKTGGTDLDAMHKAGDKEPITAIPEGLDEGAKKFLGTLTPEKQQDLLARINEIGVEQANKLYQDSREAEPEKASTSVTRDVSGKIIESKAPEKLATGEIKYLDTSREGVEKSLSRVNKDLISVVDEGARRFMENNPGYKVYVNGTVVGGKMLGGGGSGYRPGKSGHHGKGNALDITIVDPNGKALENYQSGDYAIQYQQLGNFVKLAQERYMPEYSGNIRFGGYFAGGKKNYGEMDLMHIDFGGNAKKLGQTAGSRPYRGGVGYWETGFGEDIMKKYGIDPEKNMGMKEFRKIYGYDVVEARRKENAQIIATKEASAEALSFSSAVQAPEMSGSQSVDPYKVFDEKGKPIQKKEGETARPITVPQAPKQDVLIGQPQIDVGRTIEAEKKSSATPVTPPQQKPTIPVPKQDPGALLKGLEKTPSFFAGGETQVGEDMALVNKQTGEVTAHLNSTERVQVTPQHRTSDEDIQKISKQREAGVVSQAKEDTAATTRTTSPTPRPKPQQRDQKLILDENRRLSYQSADKYKTASNQRAMARSRFMEIASDPIVGHFSDGAANMK